MPEPLVYLNGRLVPASEASIPIYDAGFVLGTTVTEQVRTFSGKLFRLADHLSRLFRSLKIVGVDPGIFRSELAAAAEDLAARNHALLAEGDDLGMAVFVTPGPYPTLAQGKPAEPLVCMHTYPLPFGLWADKYQRGESLVVPQVRQVSPNVWPRELKCRSRVHYFLADRQARAIDPDARALLLDEDGHVNEATTASMLIYERDRGIVIPPREKILPGISAKTIAELAGDLGIPFTERPLKPRDVASADEVLLASTTSCLLPVVRFDGKPIGIGRPGDTFHQLLAAWSERVGVDIAAQAARFAQR